MEKVKIYLDDVRIPVDQSWVVVKNYDEFVQKVTEIGLENIELISLDHDLGDSAMKEWLHGVVKNYEINYDNITEKTGMDCAKWLVNYCFDNNKKLPNFVVHSMNPAGTKNIQSLLHEFKQFQNSEI